MIPKENSLKYGLPFPTRWVAIDTETTGLYPHAGHQPFAAAVVWPDESTEFYRDEGLHVGLLRQIVEDPTIDKVFHNAKFDWRMLDTFGWTLRGRVWDTGIFIHLLDGRDAEGGSNLDYAAKKYLPVEYRKVTTEIEEWFRTNKVPRKNRNFQDLPRDMLKRRCVGDTALTAALFRKLFTTVATTFPYLLDLEHRVLPFVKVMCDRGVLIDMEEIEKQREYFLDIIEDVTRYAEDMLNIGYWNINSLIDQRALLEEAGIFEEIDEWTTPARNRKSKKKFIPQRSMKTRVLMDLHHPAAHMLIVGKAAQKMLSPFLKQAATLSVNNVLHCNYKQTGTVAGRFSCSEPNLQNIPVEGEEGERHSHWTEEEAEESYELTGYNFAPHIKRIFLVRPGYVHIHLDKSQAEMFALGHYSKDKKLIELLQGDESVHIGMCKLMFGEVTKGLKQRSKAVTFGYQYGAGLATIAKRVKGSISEARSLRNRLQHIFPGLPRWRAVLEQMIKDNGYVQTSHGRRHYLFVSKAYMGVNRMCQGHVADELKGCMVRIGERLLDESCDARIILNIHDELVIECAIPELTYVGPMIYRLMLESDIEHEVPIPSDMEITYTSWANLLKVEHPLDPSTYPKPDLCHRS